MEHRGRLEPELDGEVVRSRLKASLLSDFREELVSLVVCTLGDLVTGSILGWGNFIIAVFPALMVLIPGAAGMRGNVYSSLGSRIGTLLHLGVVEPKFKRQPRLMENVRASFTLVISINFYLGVLAGLLARWIGLKASVVDLAAVAVLAAVLSMVFLMPAVFVVAFLTFRKGLDPDNFSAPMITLIGDLVTLPTLFLAAYLVLLTGSSLKLTFLAIAAALSCYLAFKAVRAKKESLKILKESTPVLLLCGFLEVFAGFILGSQVEELLAVAGVLTVLPAFLEDNGALASVLAAKLATRLHAGIILPQSKPGGFTLRMFLVNHAVAAVIFPVIAAMGYAVSFILKLKAPSLPLLMFSLFTAGMLTVLLANIAAYYVSVLAYRKGMDPDNVSIPLLTSTIDLMGAGILVAVFLLLKVI